MVTYDLEIDMIGTWTDISTALPKVRSRYLRGRWRRLFQEGILNEVQTFMSLAAELRPFIIAASHQKGTARYAPNGRISPDVRLACAICWFAGGFAYDFMTTYGIGHSDTINNCWFVVDAISRHLRFDIAYPANHDKQRSIAEGFYDVSSAGFGCCASAVDGILI